MSCDWLGRSRLYGLLSVDSIRGLCEVNPLSFSPFAVFCLFVNVVGGGSDAQTGKSGNREQAQDIKTRT